MVSGLAAILFGHIAELVKLRGYAAALYASAVVILLFALGFALVGVGRWLTIAYGVDYPQLWIALGLVVVAVPFIGFGLALQTRRPKTRPATDIAMIAGPAALSLAARKLDARVLGIGALLIAGVVLGRRLTR
jgi:TRAP-type C4-dicarboxylate transport system permease small subunit